MMGTGTQPAIGPMGPRPVVTITILEAKPDRNPAKVNVGDTLQFVNKDDQDYHIWGLPIARYLGTYVLLPAQGSVGLSVDSTTKSNPEPVQYLLLPTNPFQTVLPAGGVGLDPTPFDSGGGGIIITGP